MALLNKIVGVFYCLMGSYFLVGAVGSFCWSMLFFGFLWGLGSLLLFMSAMFLFKSRNEGRLLPIFAFLLPIPSLINHNHAIIIMLVAFLAIHCAILLLFKTK